MKDLLRISDLLPRDLQQILDLAEQCEDEPHRYSDLLRDETVVCYFAKPSTRTRLSFATAITRLGGRAEVVGPSELQLGRGETIEDTARVVSQYAQAFVIRTFADKDVKRFADAATIPVINALTDSHHPCQALADMLTLRRRFGVLAGLRVAYVGDGNNVAHSLIEACALAGVNLSVATPPGYEPDSDVVAHARTRAAISGSVIAVGHDATRAVAGADAVYTDVWVSMGDPESERERRQHDLQPYQVTAELMAAASPRAVFMHCLPAHRGDEVTSDVIDGHQSVVLEQAAHRLHTEQALLVTLVGGTLRGTSRELIGVAPC